MVTSRSRFRAKARLSPAFSGGNLLCMHVLLVHGMGRTPLSMMRLAATLRRSHHDPEQFGYLCALQPVAEIVGRLQVRIEQLADADYVVVGHSLGGLLLRWAVADLPATARRPLRIIMLGTPNHSPRTARRFRNAIWFRLLNGDAGALLGSEERMAAIPLAHVPCTVIAGTAGARGRWGLIGDEANDGLVALSEMRLDDGEEWLTFPVRHPFMMNDPRVRRAVLERCAPLLR